MNINLDDKKIVKIIYAIDDYTQLHIEFKDGDICAINKKFVNLTSNNKNYLDDIKEMIEKTKSSNWVGDIVKRRNEIENDREILEKTINAKKMNEIKNLYDCKKLIDMDKNGELDEIVKKHRENGTPNMCASVFQGSISKDEDDFDRLNEGLDSLSDAAKKIGDKNKEEKESPTQATEKDADSSAQAIEKDSDSSLDKIKEDAENFIDAKKLEAKRNEEVMTELIPNFDITQILMELAKMGYFEVASTIPLNEQPFYRARLIADAVNKIKTMKHKYDK